MLREKYELPEYTIRINSRKLLKDILSKAGVSEELKNTTCSCIDKLDKLPWDKVAMEMTSKGLSEDTVTKIQELLTSCPELPDSIEMILETIPSTKLDLTLARGLDYYTGVIFEVVLNAGEKSPSIAGGGRYDEAMKIGFSLGIDRIMNFVKTSKSKVPTVWVVELEFKGKTEETKKLMAKYKLQLMTELRNEGISIGTSLANKCQSRDSIAESQRKNIPFLILLGPDEMEKGLLRLRDQRGERKEFLVNFKECVNMLLERD